MPHINLDPEQKAAVSHAEGNLLILAGAGSGKTLTLTRRAAAMLETTSAANLLLMTFTKKAAEEMRKRLSNELPPALAAELKDSWIGTFHSVCFRILKQYGEHLGLAPGWNVVGSVDADRVLTESARRSGLSDEQKRLLKQLYSFARNSKTPWRTLLGTSPFGSLTELNAAAIGGVIERYRKRCDQAGRVDFDDLQVLTAELLEDHPAIREELQARFRVVLVDEYQDTSTIQAHILKLLVGPLSRITAVGDEAQGIYGFRGASLENIRQFQEDFTAARLAVRSNYRSTPQILAVANAIIARSSLSLAINMESRSADHHKPLYANCENPVQEAAYVVRRIQQCRRDGIRLDRIAVLYRAKPLSAALQAELGKQGLPFQVFGGQEFFTQTHIRLVLDCCRLVMNPEDSIALSGVQDALRIFAGPLDEIAEEATEKQKSIWELLAPEDINHSPVARLRGIGKELVVMRQAVDAGDPTIEIVQRLISISEDQMRLLPDVDMADVREDFDVLLDLASSYATLEDLVNALLVDDWDNDPADGEKLTLSTVHSAKGLEWDVVFLIGLVDWWFPSRQAIQDTGSDEEERRLFYVAVTRAKRSLCLTSHRTYHDRSGTVRQQSLSPFLLHIPPALIQTSKQ